MTLNKDEYALFFKLVKSMESIENHLEELVIISRRRAGLKYPALSRQKETTGKENG